MTESARKNAVIATPDRLRFDEARLAVWLAEHVEGFQGPMRVAKFAGGESNPTYRLDTPGRSYVLRRKPPGPLLPSAHAVDREYRVLTALGPTPVPVPTTLALCEDEGVIGTAFFVMAHVAGRVVWEKDLSTVVRDQRRQMVEAAIRTLAALHAVDPAAIGLEDYGKPDAYFARQIGRWTKQYDAAATDEVPAMERLKAWLPTAVPDGEETSIVHGDFKLDNLIYDASSPDVLAVLDWELSTLGHPAADFAYFLMPWGLPAAVNGGIRDLDFAVANLPTMEEAIGLYADATGRDVRPVLDFAMAYNLFRFAGIVQGVYKRALLGNASSQDAGRYGAAVPLLAEAAWDYARAAGA